VASIAVVDYGMGNLRSVAKALEHVAPKHRIVIAQDAGTLLAADRVVFPGQGAMPDCMRHLEQAGLLEALLNVARNRPLFGICVGEQMLFDRSEEVRREDAAAGATTPGLGLFAGDVVRFPVGLHDAQGRALKIPHMGWNTVRQIQSHVLWDGIADDERFYFVHSFFVRPQNASMTVGTTEHGLGFTSAVARDNIFATQFHPEKSAAAGLRLYANFAAWAP